MRVTSDYRILTCFLCVLADAYSVAAAGELGFYTSARAD